MEDGHHGHHGHPVMQDVALESRDVFEHAQTHTLSWVGNYAKVDIPKHKTRFVYKRLVHLKPLGVNGQSTQNALQHVVLVRFISAVT